MSEESAPRPTNLAAMPGILVLVTLGCLFVAHAVRLIREREEVRWSGRGIERFYQDASAAAVREPVIRLRTGLGLDANDVVRLGDELFYLPDVEHVTGRSILAPRAEQSHVVLKRDAQEPREENALPAIVDFDRQLRARGVRLVILPTPSKAMLAGPNGVPLRNPGFATLLAELQARDIPVFDPAPMLADFAANENRPFMRTDSHWTPEAMRLCALLLTAFLEREGLRPDGPGEVLPGTTRTITDSGDLALLLEGKPSAKWQETITVHPVHGRDGEHWRPDADSPLLVLGDSFTNVFSLAEMGWGEHAGFAEALSQALSQSLGFPVDRLARNADGAFASRQALQEESARLEGKRVVIWQFAARELSFGDWKVLPMPEKGKADDPVAARGTIVLRGTVTQVAPVPPLERAPYRQAVMEVLVSGATSPDADAPEELVILGLGVDDRVPTALTKWQVGREIDLSVVPWREVEEDFGRLHRFALEDPELRLLDLPRFWMK